MRLMAIGLMFVLVVGFGFAPRPAPVEDDIPLDDERLSIHTLVREDIFAGWRSNDMERHQRGVRNIEELLEKRPGERADLLAWKGGSLLFRSVLAHEAGNEEEFKKLYDEALECFAASQEEDSSSIGACAVIGGSYVNFTDRLPEELQADAWQTSYDCYQIIYAKQKGYVAQLPNHMRGELLAGLAQSSLRLGRNEEYEKFRDQIIELLPGTGYSRTAKRWKENPEAAATENISCKSCHPQGRLAAEIANLNDEGT